MQRIGTLGGGLSLLATLLLTTPALAAQAEIQKGELTKTSAGYRWERGSVTFELVKGDKRWTSKEAKLIERALNRLPDVLLKPVYRLKVRTFERHKIPQGRLGKSPKASATTVVTQGRISWGDALFRKMSATRVYRTVIHELGHVAQYTLLSKTRPLWARARALTLGTPGWSSISWTSVVTYGLRRWNGFVSDYARTNDREDFAESVEFYWIAPEVLERTNARKFRFIRDRVFKGLVPPAQARVKDVEAIKSVRPKIRRLGDTSDDAGSLVRIYGNRFMGPLDGGFNRVYYGGRRALRLTVSRTSLWSWVPAMRLGSAAVRVKTPDGKSNAAAFRVKKPWWRFW